MTSKYIILLAESFARNAPRSQWSDKRQQWRQDAKHIADTCKGTNGKFNHTRFYITCGMTSLEIEELTY